MCGMWQQHTSRSRNTTPVWLRNLPVWCLHMRRRLHRRQHFECVPSAPGATPFVSEHLRHKTSHLNMWTHSEASLHMDFTACRNKTSPKKKEYTMYCLANNLKILNFGVSHWLYIKMVSMWAPQKWCQDILIAAWWLTGHDDADVFQVFCFFFSFFWSFWF